MIESFKLIQGQTSDPKSYKKTTNALPKQSAPIDPITQKNKLKNQITDIQNQIKNRKKLRDPLADREIISIQLRPSEYFNVNIFNPQDATPIGTTTEGAIAYDINSKFLNQMLRKLDLYSSKITRPYNNIINPINKISLINLSLKLNELPDDQPIWFEITCRGGTRIEPYINRRTEHQIKRALIFYESEILKFVASEQIYFFVKLSINQMKLIIESVDCIYDINKSSDLIRDFNYFDQPVEKEIKKFTLLKPEDESPIVTIIDTGIKDNHPLLKNAILNANRVDGISSNIDTDGHGTKMAGIALYDGNIGLHINNGFYQASHWIQSVKTLATPGQGTGSDDNYTCWPVITEDAIEKSEQSSIGHNRIYTMAITRPMNATHPAQKFFSQRLSPDVQTIWSHAIDELAYNNNKQRLIIVSAGNTDISNWLSISQLYPQENLIHKIHEPSQAKNALTVGAFTEKDIVAPHPYIKSIYPNHVAVSPKGGISPYTSSGSVSGATAIKPDIVMEGGNLGIYGQNYDHSIPSLCTLTTGIKQNHPLELFSMTSEATARAAGFAAQIYKTNEKLWASTVRGLIVHSASWTDTMLVQFPAIDDRMAVCGYGVPNLNFAKECIISRATIFFQDEMPNLKQEKVLKINKKRGSKKEFHKEDKRVLKIYKIPLDFDITDDADVEMRVTLSYLPEPSKFGSKTLHGIDLKWDMQGPREQQSDFLSRINELNRPIKNGKRIHESRLKSFDWEIGKKRRSRGTVQSDRWQGKLSDLTLTGDKLIAVIPVLGWWDRRKNLRFQSMKFSLIVSIVAPNIYPAIISSMQVIRQEVIV